MTAPNLTGARCQCPACGELFSSVATFDRHRVGEFASNGGTNTRRCLTVAELMAQEWPKTDRGFWLRPAPRPVHYALEGPSSPDPCQPYRSEGERPEKRGSEAQP